MGPFRKMESLEFEEEYENNAPIEFDDNDKYDKTDLICEKVKEDYDLCSACNENPFAHLVQPCGHTICTNCVKKNNCQLCGLHKLALSGADRYTEWVCYLGRSKWCSKGADCGGFNHASGQRVRSQQTDSSNSWSTENSRWFDVTNGWCNGSFRLAVLSNIHYSNSFKNIRKSKLFLW